MDANGCLAQREGDHFRKGKIGNFVEQYELPCADPVVTVRRKSCITLGI
ncbi:MAG: hypothetical protein R2788_18485 [Saprospiraceae bacterium]